MAPEIDRLAWINLESRVDRRAHMEETIERTATFSGSTEIIRHAALPPEQLVIPRSFRGKTSFYSCTVAHKTILYQACLDGVERLLLLEDDACPHPDFDRLFASTMQRLPDDWLGVWLGGYHQRRPASLGGAICRLTGAVQAHAYLLNREGIEIVYDFLHTESLGVVDQVYCSMHQRLPRFYAPEPFIVGTITSYSDNENTVVPGLAVQNAQP